MKLFKSAYKEIAKELSGLYRGTHLGHIVQLDSSTFSLSLNDGKSLYLHINGVPYLYLNSKLDNKKGISSPFYLALRKEIGNGLIEDIYQCNDDRIICFKLICLNQIFEKQIRYLIFEGISNHGNLILLDEEKKILLAFKMSSLEESRPIIKRMEYEYPKKLDNPLKEDPFDFASYNLEMEEKEDKEELRRKKSNYLLLYRRIKSRISSLKKKEEALYKEKEEASKHLNDGDVGNIILMEIANIHQGMESYEFEGMKISLDPSLSPSSNASKYFKKAKKAKRSLSLLPDNLRKIEEEKARFEGLYLMLDYLDEEALYQIEEEMGIIPKRKKKEDVSASLPYKLVYKGVNILFGKNARQNDYLSFSFATYKNHIFMHLKEGTGIHLIIQDENPSDEILGLGAEIVCYASGVSQGEVIYTSHKNIKKGNKPGLVILNEYKSIYVESIEKETMELFKNADRIRFK